MDKVVENGIRSVFVSHLLFHSYSREALTCYMTDHVLRESFIFEYGNGTLSCTEPNTYTATECTFRSFIDHLYPEAPSSEYEVFILGFITPRSHHQSRFTSHPNEPHRMLADL